MRTKGGGGVNKGPVLQKGVVVGGIVAGKHSHGKNKRRFGERHNYSMVRWQDAVAGYGKPLGSFHFALTC